MRFSQTQDTWCFSERPERQYCVFCMLLLSLARRHITRCALQDSLQQAAPPFFGLRFRLVPCCHQILQHQRSLLKSPPPRIGPRKDQHCQAALEGAVELTWKLAGLDAGRG